MLLQHPLEVSHAKGSARLLHLSLQRSTLLVGEVFAQDTLRALANAPGQALLLYPDSPHDPALPRPTAVSAPTAGLALDGLRLIVLDGTWRKSRKMLYCNPLLQQLPRLALRDLPPSHYAIRKAHQAHQLSTLEATCAALAQLEGGAAPFVPLLQAFDGFVAQQQGYQPSV